MLMSRLRQSKVYLKKEFYVENENRKCRFISTDEPKLGGRCAAITTSLEKQGK